MKLKNTACLAALLLACPLAATAVHGADYDVHYNSTPDASGKVASSGNKETPTDEWDNVYIGHASSNDASVHTVESSNNEGILGDGLVVRGGEVYGANALSQGTADALANSNIISLKNGVRFTYLSHDVYIASINIFAHSDHGNASACGNEIHVEDFKQDGKVSLSILNSSAYGGIPTTDAKNKTVKANDNKVEVTDTAMSTIQVSCAQNGWAEIVM